MASLSAYHIVFLLWMTILLIMFRSLIEAVLQAVRAELESKNLATAIVEMGAFIGKRDVDSMELTRKMKQAKAEKQIHDKKLRVTGLDLVSTPTIR